jgi:hypothetical protein
MSKAVALINSVTTRVHILRPCLSSTSASPASEEVEIDRKQVVPGDVLAVSSASRMFPLARSYLIFGLQRWRRLCRRLCPDFFICSYGLASLIDRGTHACRKIRTISPYQSSTGFRHSPQ